MFVEMIREKIGKSQRRVQWNALRRARDPRDKLGMFMSYRAFVIRDGRIYPMRKTNRPRMSLMQKSSKSVRHATQRTHIQEPGAGVSSISPPLLPAAGLLHLRHALRARRSPRALASREGAVLSMRVRICLDRERAPEVAE